MITPGTRNEFFELFDSVPEIPLRILILHVYAKNGLEKCAVFIKTDLNSKLLISKPQFLILYSKKLYVKNESCRFLTYSTVQFRTWNMEENEQESYTDSADRARLDSDPMYKLEQTKRDKNVLTDRKPQLGKLQLENAKKHGDNFELNRQLRAGLRYLKAMDGSASEEEKQLAKSTLYSI